MTKGQDTKNTILSIALGMASESSLESVTIGSLAKATEMSKSGLFAHFQSKENLQIAILEFAADDFVYNVVVPALQKKAGIPRIKALVENWVQWGDKLKGGCIFVSASTEFSERPGKVRDFLLAQQQSWIESLKMIGRSAIKVHDFRKDIDYDQFAFDLYSLLMGYHYYSILLRTNESKQRLEIALDRLIQSYQ
jgi:AcrR family transcriptional regulator